MPTKTFAALSVAVLCLGAAPARAQTASPTPSPAASTSRTGPISGYMEAHLNKIRGADATLDFHRFVLLFNHSFTSKIRFVGELELEHALVEGLEAAGELELEQAYVDFLLSRRFNIRAGMLLMPVGIINERHEPPVFHGVERSVVDTAIVPTTWFDVGAGIHGDLGKGWRYRAYVTAPLDASAFSADEGIRGGLQKGVEARLRTAAVTARVEYAGIPDLTLGASTWLGHGHFFDSLTLRTPVRLFEADARYTRDRFELRTQFAHVAIPNAGGINEAVTRLVGVDPNIASGLRGFYAEGSYRLWNQGAPRDLVAFVRYEHANTQSTMPAGWLPLNEFARKNWVAGLTYYPDPDVAVKADYVWARNSSGIFRTQSSFNLGLGWWF
jgi:hypothetical protein